MNIILKNKKGTTFIELLVYISIFLVITPVLIGISIYSARQEMVHVGEKRVSTDSQFMMDRIYRTITEAKKVDVVNSLFDDPHGRLTLVMQDDAVIVIELDPDSNKVKITERSVTSDLSSANTNVESLYFERMADMIGDYAIVLGVNVRMHISGIEGDDVVQSYIISANLERGDYDGDGCLDYLDLYPRHPQCCGDADGDGICDEMDNCVMVYNPFQEDFDGDGIGDHCDSNVYLGEGGGGGGGGGAFNCSSDDQLIALINQQPPIKSQTLKQILISSSPLPPSVLYEVIDNSGIFRNIDFWTIFVNNVRLQDDVYDKLMADPDVSQSSKVIITMAHLAKKFVPWIGGQTNTSTYQVAHLSEECGEDEYYTNAIKFYDSTNPLPPANMGQYADVFLVVVDNGTETVEVTTKTASGTALSTLIGGGSYEFDSLGFMVSLESITGDNYAFTVNSVSNTESLDSVTFYFGCGATIISPSSSYSSSRYACYCEGGCDTDCGDGGTGVLTTNVQTDRCYHFTSLLPEWCLKWDTFKDDNSDNPAYLGGTQIGEETAYWEKTFKSILTQVQMNNLQSITIGGENAYQSTTQFFCDTLSSSCPMKGELTGAQDVELYNWITGQWEVIGAMNLDGFISDQQKYEIKYNGPDPQKYFGGTDDRELKARMKFRWNGIPDEGQNKAPSFMCIDYFSAHLKW